jgi:hypothetical protein
MYSFGAEGGPIDYYLFFGPDPKQVVRTYAWLTGLPPLPPLWALGFQQSRFSYETETKVRDIARRLRTDKTPSDTIYLDIDFQEQHRPFTVCSSLEVCGHGQEIAPERQVLRHSADPFRGIGLFIVRGRIFARRNRVQCADRQSPRVHLQIVPVIAATVMDFRFPIKPRKVS